MGLVHQVSTAFGYMAVLKLKIAQPSMVHCYKMMGMFKKTL